METQRRKLESMERREGPTAGLTVRTARGEGRGPTPRMGSEAGASGSNSGGISPKGVGIVGASMIRDRSRSRLAGDHSPPLAPGSASPPPADCRCRAGSGAHAPSPPLAGASAPPAPPPQLVVAGPPGRSSPFDEDCGSEETVDVLWTADADTVRLPALAALPPPALAPLALGGVSRGVSAGSNVTVNAWGAGGVDSRASTPGSSTFRTYSMSSLADGGGSVGPTPMTPAFASPQPWARVSSTDSMSLANGGAFGSGLFAGGHGFGGGGGSGADSPAAGAAAARPHGRIRKGRWRRGKPIGMGTCGKVYLGLNDDTGELMAVKEVTLESKEKQLRELYTEIQVMHRLRHPHIVAYLGAELVDSQRTLCIFQEWVPAGSLHQLLEHFGALGERMTATYTRQVLLGLAYLHANGVIHRDVKATNVLVDDRGRVKLADFGCALLLDDSEGGGNGACSRDSLTMSIKGTPLFMAPEILLRQRSGRRVDIWSLGCVVMEMATTRPPWGNLFSHPVQLIAHFHEHKGPPPMPEGVSDRLRVFLLRCFIWDPKERPRARELLEDPFLLLGSSANIASSGSTSGIATPPMSGGGGLADADGGAGSEEEVPLERMNAQDAMQRLRKASSFDLLNSAAHRGGGGSHYGMAGSAASGGGGGGGGGTLGLRHAKSALANAPVDEDEVAAETRRRRRSAAAANRDAAVAQLSSVYATLTVAAPPAAAAAAATGSSGGGDAARLPAAPGSGGGGGGGDPALNTNALVAAALAANSAAAVVQKPASNRAAAWRLRRHSTGTCAAAAENGPSAAAAAAPAAGAAVLAAAANAAAAPLGAEGEVAGAPWAPFDTINPAAATDAAAAEAAAAAPVLAAAAAAADAMNVPPPLRPLAGPAAAVAAALEMRAAVSAATAASQPASQEPLAILAPPPPLAGKGSESPTGVAAAAGGGGKQTPLTTPQMPWSPGAADERLATVTPERAADGGAGKDRRHRAMTLAWGLRHPGVRSRKHSSDSGP